MLPELRYTPDEITEFRKQWIAELRTTKLAQCTRREIMKDQEGNIVAACACGIARIMFGNDPLNYSAKIGLEHYDENDDKDLLHDVILMNDSQEMSFPAIADVLEKRFGFVS